MLTSVRFRGGAEDADAEAKGFEIFLPKRDASGWIQGLNLPQRREDAPACGFDEALLAGPEASKEKVGIPGGADESLLLRTETAAQERVAYTASILQIQSHREIR